jgi:hypothetical protein
MPQPTVIRYVGPCDSVYSIGLAAHVKRGEPVEVADPDLAANLLAQEGAWELAHPEKTAKPAAGAKTED